MPIWKLYICCTYIYIICVCFFFLCLKRRIGNIMSIIAGMKQTMYSLTVRMMNLEEVKFSPWGVWAQLCFRLLCHMRHAGHHRHRVLYRWQAWSFLNLKKLFRTVRLHAFANQLNSRPFYFGELFREERSYFGCHVTSFILPSTSAPGVVKIWWGKVRSAYHQHASGLIYMILLGLLWLCSRHKL